MAKKNQIRKLFENMPSESAETDSETTEPIPADSQSEPSSPGQQPEQEVMQSPQAEEKPSEEDVVASSGAEEASPDDLLEDVRRSLIEEEETDKSQKESKWWRRIGKKSKSPQPEKPPVEIDLPEAITSAEVAPEPSQEPEGEEYGEQLDDLLNLLESESEQTPEPTSTIDVPAVAPEPEPEVDFDELKKQAFRPSTEEEGQKDSDVRSVALEDGEEVFVEVQAPAVNTLDERLQGFEN